MRQFIIKLPENEALDALTVEAQQAIKAFKGQFPSGRLVGSQAVLGYELKLIMADIDAETFKDVLTNGYIVEDDIVDLWLDWEIVAVEGEKVDQSKILPFMLETPVFDEEGEQIGTEPVTDLTGKIQTFSGKNWTY